MDFMQPFLRRKSNPKIQESCREEVKKVRVKVKKRVRFELNEPTCINNQRDDEIISQSVNYGTQVKIMMTKQEAARFLSKCKDGAAGILELKDIVANDLELRLPNINRVHFISNPNKD